MPCLICYAINTSGFVWEKVPSTFLVWSISPYRCQGIKFGYHGYATTHHIHLNFYQSLEMIQILLTIATLQYRKPITIRTDSWMMTNSLPLLTHLKYHFLNNIGTICPLLIAYFRKTLNDLKIPNSILLMSRRQNQKDCVTVWRMLQTTVENLSRCSVSVRIHYGFPTSMEMVD